MTPPDKTPSREDVLGAYAVEPDHGRATLERYLRDYSQYAEDLIDLSSELSQHVDTSTAPLGEEEQALIETAWKRHVAAGSRAENPLARLSVADLKAAAQALELPRQVLAAFREGRVVVASVPRWLLSRLAALVEVRIEELRISLAWAPTLASARQYKAEAKPTVLTQVTFEQLLIDAGVPPEKRAALLAERD